MSKLDELAAKLECQKFTTVESLSAQVQALALCRIASELGCIEEHLAGCRETLKESAQDLSCIARGIKTIQKILNLPD